MLHLRLLNWIHEIGRVSELFKKRLLMSSWRVIVANGRVVRKVLHILGLHGAALLRLNIMQVFVLESLHMIYNLNIQMADRY